MERRPHGRPVAAGGAAGPGPEPAGRGTPAGRPAGARRRVASVNRRMALPIRSAQALATLAHTSFKASPASLTRALELLDVAVERRLLPDVRRRVKLGIWVSGWCTERLEQVELVGDGRQLGQAGGDLVEPDPELVGRVTCTVRRRPVDGGQSRGRARGPKAVRAPSQEPVSSTRSQLSSKASASDAARRAGRPRPAGAGWCVPGPGRPELGRGTSTSAARRPPWN